MKVKFVPQNIEVEINPNKSLMHLALENGIHIHSVCKGVPSCAECRVKIVDGENNVTKPTKAEINLIGSSYYIDGRRLSCQVKCFGPVTVDTTEQIERQDNPAKKIRGFKSQKQYESKAVLDTMLLTEKPSLQSEGGAEESVKTDNENSHVHEDHRAHQGQQSKDQSRQHAQKNKSQGAHRQQGGGRNQGRHDKKERSTEERQAQHHGRHQNQKRQDHRHKR